MRASLDILAAIVRVHPGDGDQYEFAAALTGSHGVATLKGLSERPVRQDQAQAIREALADAGFTGPIRWLNRTDRATTDDIVRATERALEAPIKGWIDRMSA